MIVAVAVRRLSKVADEKPGPQDSELLLRVWGMDATGKAFFQNARARNLTNQGVVLAGVEHQLNEGDVIGVQCSDRKARCKVVRVAESGLLHKINVEVQLLENQECPWKDSIPKPAIGAPAPVAAPAPSGRDKRRFTRHKIRFPIEIRDERGGGSHMQTSATDISGRGCYVEMLIPLPLGTLLTVIFWLESQKMTTPAIVRASDPGVGMGIEFMGLSDEVQQRFQQHLEKLDDTRLGPKGPPQEPSQEP